MTTDRRTVYEFFSILDRYFSQRLLNVDDTDRDSYNDERDQNNCHNIDKRFITGVDKILGVQLFNTFRNGGDNTGKNQNGNAVTDPIGCYLFTEPHKKCRSAHYNDGDD